jgi:hypothetical protein
MKASLVVRMMEIRELTRPKSIFQALGAHFRFFVEGIRANIPLDFLPYKKGDLFLITYPKPTQWEIQRRTYDLWVFQHRFIEWEKEQLYFTDYLDGRHQKVVRSIDFFKRETQKGSLKKCTEAEAAKVMLSV